MNSTIPLIFKKIILRQEISCLGLSAIQKYAMSKIQCNTNNPTDRNTKKSIFFKYQKKKNCCIPFIKPELDCDFFSSCLGLDYNSMYIYIYIYTRRHMQRSSSKLTWRMISCWRIFKRSRSICRECSRSFCWLSCSDCDRPDTLSHDVEPDGSTAPDVGARCRCTAVETSKMRVWTCPVCDFPEETHKPKT